MSLFDHDFVNLTLDTRTFWNRGPGVWRLNTSILSDPNYEKLINDFFDNNPRPTNGTPLGQWWDYMKNQIKPTTVSYCKAKKRASRNERHKLILQLTKAKQRLTDGDNSAFKEVKNLENELKILNLNELESVKIRSRSQWIEDGEKPSRYFFSLERKRANDNHISSFFTKQNTEVTEKDDLISTATEFDQNLCSKLLTDKNMQAELINNLDAHLSPDNAALCDGLFTLNELYDAASKMAHSKTPGLDSFPVEFYLKFWGRTGKILIDVFNESFTSGSLPQSQKLSLIRLIHKKQDQRLLKNW